MWLRKPVGSVRAVYDRIGEVYDRLAALSMLPRDPGGRTRARLIGRLMQPGFAGRFLLE